MIDSLEVEDRQCLILRTAVYEPVCTVVWEGGRNRKASVLIGRGYGTARPPQRLQKHGLKRLFTAGFTGAKELRLKFGEL